MPDQSARLELRIKELIAEKKERDGKFIRQSDVADYIGMSHSNFSRLCRYADSLRFEYMLKLTEYFETDMNGLFKVVSR